MLKVEPDTLQQTKLGTISGRIYLQSPTGGFPALGWTDLIIPVLCAWLSAIRTVAGGGKKQVVHFMDGPYYVELNPRPQGMISLLLIEDRANAGRQELSAASDMLLRNASEAADLLLSKCRKLGWDNSDLDQLNRLRQGISY